MLRSGVDNTLIWALTGKFLTKLHSAKIIIKIPTLQPQADHPLFVGCNYCLELDTLYSRDTIG